jgi:NAD(P)-dependent dehydrogenase (short-subunit alcohol dehydrogenase family)
MAFGPTTTTDDVIAGVDLHGTVAVVTGASTGIGIETARALASAGAEIVLAGRNAAKHDVAMATLRDQVPGARLGHVELDLTSLDSARRAAAEIRERHDRVQLLVNNAGVMYTPLERTAEGFELQFGTNHLGHFVFTNHLLPVLLAGTPARIVNLSSGGHRSSDIDWEDPNYQVRPYDKFQAYGQAKTANILFTVELERRLAGRGVHAFAVHPGMIVTELSRYMSRDDLKELRSRIAASATSSPGGAPTYKTVPQGAATTVWACTATGLGSSGGRYLADCAVSDEVAPWAMDEAAAQRLWALSETLTGEHFDL